jgi:MFS family permease
VIYIPTIIKGLGYTKLTANALSSVGGFGTIILTPLNAFGSDLTNRRAFFVWLPLTWTLILISIVYSQSVSNSWRQYSVWTLLNAGIATFHPVNGAWLSINSKTPQERSISLALWIMSANLSGVCGAQIFRAEDAPLYRKGVLAIVVLTATGWGITIFQGVQYYLSNRRLDKVYGKVDRSRRESDSESQSSRDSDLSVKEFRYVV